MPAPTNTDRAEWAMKALQGFAATTGLDIEEEFTEAVGDLVADLMHLCVENEVDFELVLQNARSNFEAEIEDESNVENGSDDDVETDQRP